MQPLDVSVYGPFKTYYNKAMDSWMRTHPGQTASIYAIPEIVHETFLSVMTPRNIVSGFRSTDIFPFNRDIFPQEAPSMVTDRPNPDRLSTPADLPAPAPSVTGPESTWVHKGEDTNLDWHTSEVVVGNKSQRKRKAEDWRTSHETGAKKKNKNQKTESDTKA